MSDKMKVVPLPKKKEPTSVTADEILEKGKGMLSEDMLVVGWNKEGDSLVFITPCRDKATLVYLLEYMKLGILSGDI
jgi:hypothetical protein